MKNSSEIVTLGAGCFWCVEAVFQDLKGVSSVVSGYSGGFVEKPSYEDVCKEITGHAEVIQVTYDPLIISFEELLEVFFQTHNPTTLNRQGADVGTQYRSSVFYHSEDQKVVAERIITQLNGAGAFKNKIVTEVVKYSTFSSAENYHKDYFDLHGDNPYCALVIKPKLDKLKEVFGDKLK
jgi:peptide-methionine (S)-S-oxide reductase